MDHIFQILPKVLRKRGLAKHASGAFVASRTKKWLDDRFPHLSDMMRVQTYENGHIIVGCDHAIALQECQAASDDLLRYLKQELPFEGIQGVRFMRKTQ